MLDGGWLFPGLNPVEPLTAVDADQQRTFAGDRRTQHRDVRGISTQV
jgi:hypothetical protein